jgi:glycosyltransferase involved in cell wall biosynthesis
VHTRAPHDGRYLEVHRELCDKLGKLADQIHLHSHAALEELERDRQLDRDKVTIIPHGNYRPLFPNPGRRVPTDGAGGRRFLLFGRLGRYKGGEELVRCFARLGDGQARLVIAGKQIDPVDLSDQPESVRERITVHNRFLSEAELLAAFEAADFVVSPYLATLTSGTILLAMSLARPVIVPRLPTLAELVVEDDNGLLFAPDDLSSLEEALGRANRMSAEAWRRMAGRAFATANRYDWRVIGHSLSGLLYRLIAKPRVRHAVGDRVVAD